MKKLIAIVLVFNILLSSPIVLAAKSRSSIEKIDKISMWQKRELKIDVQELSRSIEKNKTKLKKLIKDSDRTYNRAKANIIKILRKKDKLMQIEIEALKNAIDLLELYKDSLNSMNDSMETEYGKLKKAKNRGDLVLQKQIMYRIIDLQNSRIHELKKIIVFLNEVADM